MPAGWSGTIAPNLVTHDFSPLSYDLVDVQADQIGLDFLAHDPHVHEVPGEFPSIASALVVCTDGDTILLAAGSYSGPENTDINFGGLDLALIGAGAEATVIDASDEPGDPVCIRLENDETRATLIQGLTLRGSSGGCLYSVSGTASPTVRDCIIEEGGLHVGYSTTSAVSFHGGAPLFENCLFQRNRGSAVGCSQGTQAEFLDCRFESNTSSSGAAVKVSNSEASFTRCEFRENRADAVFLQEETGWAGRGGAVCVWGSESPGSTVFEDCLFAGNVAKSYTDQYDPPLQSGAGGALYVRDASVSLLRCTIVDNEAEMIAGEEILGGGLFAMDASVTLDQCIVALNRGGGLYASNAASDPSLACSDVWANENGDFLGGASDPTGQDGNISLDPYFCEVVADDFTLESNSPCLPPHNDCGLQMGAFGLGCTNTASESVPANLTLHLRAHPNPFNPVTTIAFAPLASGPVTLTVHDIAGRLVATLLDGEQREAGQNELVWDASGLGSGIYLILLEAGDQRRSDKVVLIK